MSESATNSYDDLGQLTVADRVGASQIELFSCNANGNRLGSGYQVGANNRLTSDAHS